MVSLPTGLVSEVTATRPVAGFWKTGVAEAGLLAMEATLPEAMGTEGVGPFPVSAGVLEGEGVALSRHTVPLAAEARRVTRCRKPALSGPWAATLCGEPAGVHGRCNGPALSAVALSGEALVAALVLPAGDGAADLCFPGSRKTDRGEGVILLRPGIPKGLADETFGCLSLEPA